MDDPLLVRRGQRVAHFTGDTNRLVDGELPLAAQPVPQRFAVYIGHHEVEETGGLARVVQRQDGIIVCKRGAYVSRPKDHGLRLLPLLVANLSFSLITTAEGTGVFS